MLVITSKPLPFIRRINKLIIRSMSVSSCTKLKPFKEIPGPPSLPFIGVAVNFFPGIGEYSNMEDFSIVADELYAKHGPLVRFQGGMGLDTAVLIYDANSIEEVLRGEDKRMPQRPGFPSLEHFRKLNKTDSSSTGLLTEQNEPWKSFRTTVNPVMLQPKIVKMYSDEIDQVAQDMIQRLKSIRNEKNMIDENFEVEINKWALESIGVVALGARIGCLRSDLPEDSPARKLIQCVRDTFELSDKLDNKPGLWRYIRTPNYVKAMKAFEDHRQVTVSFIKKAMEEYKERMTQSENKGVLEKLLEVNEDVAVVMASDMLFAGVDTTASTVVGALYMLGSNPDAQTTLRNEVLSTTKDERRPYLKGVIKETLRLLPIAGANLRRATRDYQMLGYEIPKGTNMITMHESLSKMDSQFPRAKEFLPERWTVGKNDELYYGNAHPLAYAPFGFGTRMCIGRRIAELEMEKFLARFVENFEVEWFGPPPKRKTTPINYILPPFNFILKDLRKCDKLL